MRWRMMEAQVAQILHELKMRMHTLRGCLDKTTRMHTPDKSQRLASINKTMRMHTLYKGQRFALLRLGREELKEEVLYI